MTPALPLRTPQHWKDYELIDSGGFEKLERFGPYVLARPEPQAVWSKALPVAQWEKTAHAWFRREKGGNGERGEWSTRPEMPGQWQIGYQEGAMNLRFRLGLTSFKHVGLFPEQADNWSFIYQQTKAATAPRVLNLFAYTGGASLAARAAGADVTHLDSVRQVVSWAKENMEASRLDGIRWVVEDALKFAQREQRRGRTYDGIILDPPAYGRGPDGEKWVLEEHIGTLLETCRQLLHPGGWMVLSLYSMGFSALIAENLLRDLFPKARLTECGELFVPDRHQHRLPLGLFARVAGV